MALNFEKLHVWQRALAYTVQMHQLTSTFPKEERYVLSTQLKRATDSIALNIAEGATGQSKKEFRRFLGYAIRSTAEVIACLHVALGRELIDATTFSHHYEEAVGIIRMTQALRNSMKADS